VSVMGLTRCYETTVFLHLSLLTATGLVSGKGQTLTTIPRKFVTSITYLSIYLSIHSSIHL